MILEPLQVRRPFDPTGKSTDNYVHAEIHTLPHLVRRIIVPKLGAFYAESLVVRQNQKVLQLGKDYELAALYHDATVVVGKDVNVMIVFINGDIVGEVEISYQVVGGEFTGTWEAIQQYVNVLLVDPRKVKWDDIMAKPDFYAPREHFHDINDVYGLNELIPYLEEIIRSLKRIKSKEFRAVYQRIIDTRTALEDANEKLAARVSVNEKTNETQTVDINALKERVKDNIARIIALENDDSVERLGEDLNEKIRLLRVATENLDRNKASKEELNQKYDALMNAIKAYFDSENKLKEEHIPLANKPNQLYYKKGEGLKVDYPTIVTDPIKFYVDAVNGNDGNPGTEAKPFQSLGKALSEVLPYKAYRIYLKAGQTHILTRNTKYNAHKLKSTQVQIAKYSSGDSPVLQLGQTDRTTADRYCILLSDSKLTLSYLNIQVCSTTTADSGDVNNRAVIAGNVENIVNNNNNNNNNNNVLFITNSTVNLAEETDMLYSEGRPGVSILAIEVNMLNIGGITGNGRLIGTMSISTELLFFTNSTELDKTWIYKPNPKGLEQVKKYFPHLKRNPYGVISGGIVTNIDPNVLPLDSSVSNGVSTAADNLLHVYDNGLYVGPTPPEHIRYTYVDAVNGVDAKDRGSKDKPFKTLPYAMNLYHGYRRDIYLKEGQEHIFSSAVTLYQDDITILPYGDKVDALPGSSLYDKKSTRKLYDLNTRIVFKPTVGMGNNANMTLIYSVKNMINWITIYGIKLIRHAHPGTASTKFTGDNGGINDSTANIGFRCQWCGFEFVGNEYSDNRGSYFFTGTTGYNSSLVINLNDPWELKGTGLFASNSANCRNLTIQALGGLWVENNGANLRKYFANVKRLSNSTPYVKLAVADVTKLPINIDTVTGNNFRMYANPTNNSDLYNGAPGLQEALFRFSPNNVDWVDLNRKFSAVDMKITSDIRLKEDIERIEDPIQKVEQLHGYTFRYKDMGNDVAGGLIAQEVEKVLPSLVHENEDGYKSLSYNGIIGLLVEVVKSQQKQIDVLYNTIKHLKDEK